MKLFTGGGGGILRMSLCLIVLKVVQMAMRRNSTGRAGHFTHVFSEEEGKDVLKSVVENDKDCEASSVK